MSVSENAYRIAVLTKYVPDTQFEQKLDDTFAGRPQRVGDE